jgi:DNA-binding beta-propeller fold protein YncE
MRGAPIACIIAAALIGAAPARAEAPLLLEAKIALPDVIGQLDGLAVDRARGRVFVAELGNDSVGIVDLAREKLVHRLPHLKEPRGLAFLASSDTLYVACGLDGALRLFRGTALAAAGVIAIGPEPDEIRADAASGLIYVGYGGGAIAVVDDATRQVRGEITLREHPAGLALTPDGKRLLVNVAAAHEIAVIDAATDKRAAVWLLHDGRDNVPLALDGERVITVFRRPPLLAALSARDGKTLAALPTCADAGGVFVDAARRRLYVVCGEGAVDVFEPADAGFRRLARLPTGPGARTGMFIPELDRLVVAVPATPASAVTEAAPRAPAALWIFRPVP